MAAPKKEQPLGRKKNKANYTPGQKQEVIEKICQIIETGKSLRTAIKHKDVPINKDTFHRWIDRDKNLKDHYARACEERAAMIFEDIIDIADDRKHDEKALVGINHVHRDKLRIDARKWILAKMYPNTYGDKLDFTSGGNPVKNEKTIVEFKRYDQDKGE